MTDSQSHSRKDQLLDAARARFIADGFASTPVSAIVREAGVAQGTFYLYFKSKQDLITELRREVVRAYESALREIAGLPLPTDERLARIIVAMSVVVGKHVELERVFRQSGSGAGSLEAAREGRRRLADHAAALLSEEMPDAVHMAGIVVILFDQLLFEAHAFAPESIDTVLRDSLRFTLRGLGVEHPRVEALVSRREEFLHDLS